MYGRSDDILESIKFSQLVIMYFTLNGLAVIVCLAEWRVSRCCDGLVCFSAKSL